MEKIAVGQILKPQGIRGEIKVNPLTRDINRFSSLKEIYLGEEDKPRVVRGCRIAGGAALMFIDGILNRNDAEKTRGLYIYVSKDNAVTLQKGENFICDVIGCKIIGDDGVYLGTVKSIFNNGAADVYEIENGGKSIMFPYIRKLNAEIDVKNKKITVSRKIFEEVACCED
jgi:16S rRNA processing protein RimM